MIPVLEEAPIDEDVVAGSFAADESSWLSPDDSGSGTDEAEEDLAEHIAPPGEESTPWEAEAVDAESIDEPWEEVFAFVAETEEGHTSEEALVAPVESDARDVLHDVADRLESVAERLRTSSLDELLRSSGDDPLALLLTGFVLGASQKRRED